MKENAFKLMIAAVWAALGVYFRELIGPVVVLIVVMGLDYISGMADAWASKTLSSKVGVLGLVKKLCYMIAVAVAVVVDLVIQVASAKAGIDIGSVYACGLLVTVWLILNECISILENLSELGVPLPSFLLKIVERLRKNVEDQGELAESKEAPHDGE